MYMIIIVGNTFFYYVPVYPGESISFKHCVDVVPSLTILILNIEVIW
jgi:hypothetical protein